MSPRESHTLFRDEPGAGDVLDTAIGWAVKLQSGFSSPQERAACESWRAAHPAHERAWQQIQRLEQLFHNVPRRAGPMAYQALQGAAHNRSERFNRRRLLKTLAIGAVGLGLGLALPWQVRTPHRTAIGERRRFALADGTHLHLNTDSAVEVVFSVLRRLIVLQRGEIFIETGGDERALAARPFRVETAQVGLEALGTRFAVREVGGETRLHVAEGTVAVHARDAAPVLVRAGGHLTIGAAGPVPAVDPTFDATAWADGALVARQMRLDAFVAELSRYRTAPLHCDPAAAPLRVSGVFQLDGADPGVRALVAVARTLPVALRRGRGDAITVVRA